MAITLANTAPLDLGNPAANRPPLSSTDIDEFLSKLQGNILKSHGRDHVEIRFLQVTSQCTPANMRAVLQALGHCVTTAAEQTLQAKRIKLARARQAANAGVRAHFTETAAAGEKQRATTALPEEAFVSVSLTKHAFIKLGKSAVTDSWLIRKDNLFWGPAPNPHPDFKSQYVETTEPVAVVVLIAHAHATGCRLHWDQHIWPKISNIAGLVLHPNIEIGQTLRAFRADGPHGRMTAAKVEHFGYRDGISHPRFLTSDPDTTPWNSFRPLDSVLVSDSHYGGANSFGSFFVLMNLEQNPRAFRAKALHARPGNPEAYYAEIMGRFRDGKPIVPAAPGELHQFNYAATPGQCPFHAHIRRANPRDSTLGTPGSAPEAPVLFPRRSITYGTRALNHGILDETVEPPTGGVGILFMGHMSSLQHQMGTTLDKWLKSPNFPQPNTPLDEIMSGSHGGEKFVTNRGRLNLFTPSKTTLLHL